MIKFLAIFILSIFSYAHSNNYYNNPGIVEDRAGSDHLYNLENEIGLSIEVIKPPEFKYNLAEELIRKKIIEIVNKSNTARFKISKETSLPFLHFLLMIVPVDKGYILYASGRLFEDVDIKRVVLEKDTEFQAITWENQHLFFTPREDLIKEIDIAVEKITKHFLERLNFFQKVKN